MTELDHHERRTHSQFDLDNPTVTSAPAYPNLEAMKPRSAQPSPGQQQQQPEPSNHKLVRAIHPYVARRKDELTINRGKNNDDEEKTFFEISRVSRRYYRVAQTSFGRLVWRQPKQPSRSISRDFRGRCVISSMDLLAKKERIPVFAEQFFRSRSTSSRSIDWTTKIQYLVSGTLSVLLRLFVLMNEWLLLFFFCMFSFFFDINPANWTMRSRRQKTVVRQIRHVFHVQDASHISEVSCK